MKETANRLASEGLDNALCRQQHHISWPDTLQTFARPVNLSEPPENSLIGLPSSADNAGLLSKQSTNTAAAGIAICVIIVAAVASLGYFQFAYAPSIYKTSSSATTSTGLPPPGHYINVTILNGASGHVVYGSGFSPDNITVVLGVNATVIWNNNDTSIHTVTSYGSGPAALNSGDIPQFGTPGNYFMYTFTAPGNYQYHCTIHPWMEGSIIVKAGSGATSTTSTSSSA